MRAKRGRQETDDPLLTPWELGELGSWELGCRCMCRVQGAGCRVLQSREIVELPGCCSDKGRGLAVAGRRDNWQMRLSWRCLTDDVHAAGTLSHSGRRSPVKVGEVG